MISAERAALLALLEEQLTYTFRDREQLNCALTHRSYTHEQSREYGDYERMEFLGDAVLNLLIGDYLYIRYPEYQEGQLSQLRARLVSEQGLALLARHLHLGAFLLLGRGEEHNGGRHKDSLLAAAFEAMIAAIYLESDFQQTQSVFLRCFGSILMEQCSHPQPAWDYKGLLQQQTLRLFGCLPTYRLLRAEGPPHRRTFHIQLTLPSEHVCVGTGRSKKAAEQHAAQQLLTLLVSQSPA